jgi:hypothetical protein
VKQRGDNGGAASDVRGDGAELDPLFNGVDYETSEAQAKRNKVLLDELFTTDKNT